MDPFKPSPYFEPDPNYSPSNHRPILNLTLITPRIICRSGSAAIAGVTSIALEPPRVAPKSIESDPIDSSSLILIEYPWHRKIGRYEYTCPLETT